MGAEVRLATTPEEVDAGYRAVGVAFLERPTPDVIAWRREVWSDNRIHIALDDGVVCGVTAAFDTPLTLPGGARTTMAGVTGVGVLPTHRRRGHLTRLMEAQLADAADRGVPLAGLIAAEWPIYGRYGYGSAIPAATYEVASRLAAFIDPTWHGTVELVELDVLRELAPPVFERSHEQTPGAIGRGHGWWDATLGTRPRPGWKDEPTEFRAVHRSADGTVDGYVIYATKGRWERSVPDGRVDVVDLVTTTPGAYADVWRFLCEIDWISTVKASPRPVDEPLPFLLHDGRAVQQTHAGDHIWLRLLDVATVLSSRAYRTPGSLVLEVVDDALGRGGRFRLEVDADGATCAPSTQSPDLTLPIATLGAVSAGGTQLSTLARAGLVDEHTPGAVQHATTLFGWSPAPFCSTNF